MFILASNSPRRRALLALGGWRFDVLPAEIDESMQEGEQPRHYVLRLACEKAQAVAGLSSSQAMVIAADTTVVDDGAMLGKPANAAEAEAMLRRLRGDHHQVYTALCLVKDGVQYQDICATDVCMRSYSDTEILAYIASGDPLDKAGAYAIQHNGFHPVERLYGCYANVVGLPLCHLMRLLEPLKIYPDNDLPGACQRFLGYRCPVFQQILSGAL